MCGGLFRNLSSVICDVVRGDDAASDDSTVGVVTGEFAGDLLYDTSAMLSDTFITLLEFLLSFSNVVWLASDATSVDVESVDRRDWFWKSAGCDVVVTGGRGSVAAGCCAWGLTMATAGACGMVYA